MQLQALVLDALIAAARKHGYPVYEKGEYNVNTFGVRAKERAANRFDDAITVFYKVGGRWQLYAYKATTDPGAYWLQYPSAAAGTAIVAPGFYPGVYALGHHKRQPALKQIGNLTVYRDNDRDLLLDCNPETLTIAGPECAINIHYSAGEGKLERVDRWSAGCQVLGYGLQSPVYLQFLQHYGEAAKRWGNRVSYGLLDEQAVLG